MRNNKRHTYLSKSSVIYCVSLRRERRRNSQYWPSCEPQNHIQRYLYLLKAEVTCVGAPDWCSIACDKFPDRRKAEGLKGVVVGCCEVFSSKGS